MCAQNERCPHAVPPQIVPIQLAVPHLRLLDMSDAEHGHSLAHGARGNLPGSVTLEGL